MAWQDDVSVAELANEPEDFADPWADPAYVRTETVGDDE